MNILAFAASSSTTSINKALIGYGKHLLEGGLVANAAVEVIDLNDYEMPIYSIDQEKADGIHPLARDFYDRIGRADALLISFAEHNGFYTAAYKNIFDWASRIDKRVYQGKPTVMLSTSTGPRGGSNVLATAVASARFYGNDVKASLSIPSFRQNFDVESRSLSDPTLDAQFRATLAAFSVRSSP
ncbi:MAG: NAD(P)H-dependent oxidoreductase [Rubricoccaceae bacterium]